MIANLFCLLLLASPAEGRVLIVGTHAPDFDTAHQMASPGDTLVFPDGVWKGNFQVTKSLTLEGRSGRLDGMGSGTVLTIDAPDVIVRNMIITGSGTDLSAPDCGIYVTGKSVNSKLIGNQVSDCTFGIWIHETRDMIIENNTVTGATEGHPSNRGNGIHLFDGTNLLVKANKVTGGRDGIYISATEDSLITENHVVGTRYGVHYMFSYDNTLTGNHCQDNTIGFALMQSRNLIILNNTAAGNSRNGILFRDAQYCRIEGNQLIRNGEGMFFYSSTDNLIRNNLVQANEVGAKVWAGSYRNNVTGNRFLGNRKQIFFVGSADLDWGREDGGNVWSDYLGWDQDGDGYGDRPYRVNSFGSNLVYRFPSAALLLRSPALELLGHMEQRLPVFKAPTVVDHAPLTNTTPTKQEDRELK